MRERWQPWLAAVAVMLVAATLVTLDLTVRSLSAFGSRHPFATSTFAGLLVLLLTVLIVNRVIDMREQREQSRVVGANAAIIVGQATRATEAVSEAALPGGSGKDASEEASGQMRTYMLMLLITAPVLLKARASRQFLESAERLAAELFRAGRAERAADWKASVDGALERTRLNAAPLLGALDLADRSAVGSEEAHSQPS